MANLPPTLDSGGAKENPLRVIFSPLVSLDNGVHLLKESAKPLQVEIMLVQSALGPLPVGPLGETLDFIPNDFPGGPPNLPNKFLPGSDPLGTQVAGEGGSPIENVMELMHDVKNMRACTLAVLRLCDAC